jgi:hypothetical protein
MYTTISTFGIKNLADVSEDEEVEQCLHELALKTEATAINVYPNFQNHRLLPPTCGISLNYRLGERFYADAFRVDKYRVIAIAKLNLTQESFTTEKGKEFEKRIRRCLNFESITPPTLTDDYQVGWGASLGNRRTRIGLYSMQEMDQITRTLTTNYYLICHCCLPESYLSELNQEDEDVDRDNYLFETGYNGNVGNVKSTTRLVTNGEHFGETSSNFRALEIARENACRLLYVASCITGLPLETSPHNTQLEYNFPDESQIDSKFDNDKLLVEALQFYGLGVTIFPFTVLASYDKKVTVMDLPPEHLRGYPLGYYVSVAKQSSGWEKLKKQYDIDFEPNIIKAIPLSITDYNTYRIKDFHSLIWMTGVTDTGVNVLADEGVEFGYKCYNYRPKNESRDKITEEWNNYASNTFPVVFPVERINNRTVSQESISKCFSLTAGGLTMIHGKPPESLYETEKNIGLLQTQQASVDFNRVGTTAHFVPVKVFTPDGPTDIWTFPNV